MGIVEWMGWKKKDEQIEMFGKLWTGERLLVE